MYGWIENWRECGWEGRKKYMGLQWDYLLEQELVMSMIGDIDVIV